jgi:phosphate transport system substrate-binding protein
MEQLDGIFGSQRTGAYRGLKWHSEFARGPEKDIRTWGQLGLKGEWANKEIHTYGYAYTGMTNYFQQEVLKGGDKWNPNYKQYAEYNTKMVMDGPEGEKTTIKYMLINELSNDKYGIAWTGVPHTADVPGVKEVPLSKKTGQPFVKASKLTVQDKTYPLSRLIFMFLKRPPGRELDPKVREFVRYILSKQGQQDVIDHGVYLPLTAEAVEEQLKKLD